MSTFRKNGFLPEHQFGFRKYLSNKHVVALLFNDLLSAKDASLFSGGLLVDISKAFDTVDHCRLLQKLNYCGLDVFSQLWSKNYLLNRRRFKLSAKMERTTLRNFRVFVESHSQS